MTGLLVISYVWGHTYTSLVAKWPHRGCIYTSLVGTGLRTTLDFQGPHRMYSCTRNVISQSVQKSTFPVHANRTLPLKWLLVQTFHRTVTLDLFAPPTSLHCSAHCLSPLTSLSYDSLVSWTTKKHYITLSRPLHSTLKKIWGLFRTVQNTENSQAFPIKSALLLSDKTGPK